MQMHYRNVRMDAVIFDMDRLLVETSAIWEEPAKTLMTKLGLQWTVDVSRLYRGMDAKDVVNTIFRLYHPDHSIASCYQIYREALLKAFQNEPICPLPGANEILKHLWGNVPLALASGSPQEGIEEALKRLEWRDYFEVVVSSEDVDTGRGKPFPDVFLAAARRLQVSPSQCLVIEDALAGVQAARAAGMQCLTVPTAEKQAIENMGVECFGSLLEVLARIFHATG